MPIRAAQRLSLATILDLATAMYLGNQRRVRRALLLAIVVPLNSILDIWRLVYRFVSALQQSASNVHIPTATISDANFAKEDEFRTVIDKLEASGLRSTGSKAHEDFIDWIKSELAKYNKLQLSEDSFDILRWQTRGGMSLQKAGHLVLSQHKIPVAGAVPFSKPTTSPGVSGHTMYLPRNAPFGASVQGKIVLRPLPSEAIPNALGFLPSYHRTPDLNRDIVGFYERPSFWEHPMHDDLVAAAHHGAAGVIFLSDLPRDQLASYWDPHQGTHYSTPALLVGHNESELLKRSVGELATIEVDAEISPARTRNLFAKLPGQITERIVYVSHTDGNTCVQDNGVAALLTLARYFVAQPLSSRRRTIVFAFNTAHLHVSKEGSGRHAEQLDKAFEEDDDLTLVIPIEHMGTRELEAYPQPSGGRKLEFTGRGEMMLWCVGPSPSVVAIVQEAVRRHKLDRVLITRGTSPPELRRVPLFDSFGGLGTLYHNCLVPTTSLISGPWSLFAPSFGPEAIDIRRLRKQTLAVGDIFLALEGVDRNDIVCEYKAYRKRRADGGNAPGFVYPPETL